MRNNTFPVKSSINPFTVQNDKGHRSGSSLSFVDEAHFTPVAMLNIWHISTAPQRSPFYTRLCSCICVSTHCFKKNIRKFVETDYSKHAMPLWTYNVDYVNPTSIKVVVLFSTPWQSLNFTRRQIMNCDCMVTGWNIEWNIVFISLFLLFIFLYYSHHTWACVLPLMERTFNCSGKWYLITPY